MRHARIERWARGASIVHGVNATAKVVAALVVLGCISTLQHNALVACGIYFFLLAGMALVAELPLGELLTSACVVLPFAASFALISAFAGQRERAVLLVLRTYLSSVTALILVGTTSMPALISGLEVLRVPRFLLLVMQFLYRYLVVLFEEAAAIRDAGASRGGSLRTLQLQQAGAAAGVLFARSYHRAGAIHQAMVARGFEGSIPTLTRPAFTVRDGAFAVLVSAVFVGVRMAVR